MNRWHHLTLWSASAFAAFSAAHLIDDFLAGLPAEFNLSEPVTLLLALAYMFALTGLIAAAARGSQAGYTGLITAGVLITAAQFAKSVPEILQPGSWRAGPISVFLVIGLVLSGMAMSIAAARCHAQPLRTA